MSCYKKLLLGTLIFPVALCARANYEGKVEGVLHGYVMDAVTKRPLPGVTVSAILPGTNNSKEVTTDADGYFRFIQLPGAQVTVQFDKKGYVPTKRPCVTLKEKASVTLNIEFTPDEMESDANADYPVLRLMQAG
ncbi:MAG: carboxypeptidase-like regulatory domain-containing protein [Bacteroidota bacterium]|nr:carboxypeptidase-like regulatory domain-containing protein [Bacteroidota bacterium]MDP4215803.1 carboxypeptidase-like regulatory domain-containing protein [Bacteroidota bacterium]MDP4245298.1 carboxypeptidase-like regulatory domain-containing protein [Bacteroidota bacterium]MDP4253648.1 carboxypeptidase-like regulatory domain-containing protein [Bacteroidota bacterium]MDP4256593.1 carboxypeptidase-like regulatory domain-containing protein [Bacteroidota bacterium]